MAGGREKAGAAVALRPAVRWLTGVAVLATVAINLAGLGAIAVSRRGALEEAQRLLRLDTEARAAAIESALASSRADLAFMTGSPIFFGLESALGSDNPTEARWRRLEAEGALLLYMRGHPETERLQAHSEDGEMLVAATRRGGVPVVWAPRRDEMRGATDAAESGGRPIIGRFEFTTGVRRVSGAVALEGTIDAAKLLAHIGKGEERSRSCALFDRNGELLGAEAGAPDSTGTVITDSRNDGRGAEILASAAVQTDGWSAPSPWSLLCAQRRGSAVGLLEPLSARYRTTLQLNLAVMSLALLLGMFAIRESRRRLVLEGAAREETRVRELERQLFHAERLSTAGRLAAGMAHEINNPLEGLSNYLSLARDELNRGDAAAARRRLDEAREGLGRAADLVHRVLQHADPAAAPHVDLDLNEVARETIAFVRPRPEFAGIRFDDDLSPAPLVIRGSRALLGQVFLNLILNACEAQPAGGEVTVATRREADRVVAEIADRGSGLPATEGSRIFEPFFSTKQSTGLGLSICFSIITQHSGTLIAESRQGGGALFRLTLPAALPATG
jgi:signal transduction histidine kinase